MARSPRSGIGDGRTSHVRLATPGGGRDLDGRPPTGKKGGGWSEGSQDEIGTEGIAHSIAHSNWRGGLLGIHIVG